MYLQHVQPKFAMNPETLYMMKKSRLNKEWHLAHPMPEHPTLDQRLEWHLEHAKHCSCREMPPRLREELVKRKLLQK